MLMAGAEWVHSVNAMRPYWWVRTLTGITMDIGISLVVYTLMKTSLTSSAVADAAR
jgi:cytochrome c oxidase cbb3-type subunit 1